MKTPAALGYRMPAEWERHRATWIGWPHQEGDWPGKLAAIPFVMAEIVRRLAMHETVAIIVRHAAEEKRARGVLEKAGVNLEPVDFYRMPTDRSWLRDIGPIFVRRKSGRTALVDFGFNAWANYSNFKADDQAPAHMARFLHKRRFVAREASRRIVMEGGAIDTNGRGVLLATEECLLSEVQQRNPGLGREDYERIFQAYLGIERVVWLGGGIVGDDTHGHVDDIARFVDKRRVAACIEHYKSDPNYAPLSDNARRLESAGLEVVELPMPSPLYFDGHRLPASYANFYIANGVVLVPTFNDPKDRVALEILAGCFPKREIVGIHAVDLVWGFGTIHCLTQQEPA